MPEVVGDAGILVEHGSIFAIVDSISHCLNDDSCRADLGRRARQRAVELFSYERRKRELAAILEEVQQVP